MFLVACAGTVAAGANEVETFALEDVEKGQRGYGLSVFSGSTIERFEVEVLGVWENLQPGTSYVLARLEGQGLEDSGVIAGMSGSPVYLDGKLLGAVSFGWPFSREPIAGITPAHHMRAMEGRAQSGRLAAGLPRFGVERLLGNDLGEADLRAGLARLRPRRIGDAPAAIEWTTAGFGSEVRSLLSEELGAVVSAGAGRSSASADGSRPDLLPGSAVAAVLVDGDFRLAATGTVTDRAGDSILAFGHPFLGVGSLSIPMASAEVLTVVSSQWTSFKVANLGPVVGAVEYDFLTGIRGSMGAEAPVVPMVVRSAAGDPIRVSLAKIPGLTPTLAAITALGALGAQTETAGAQSLDLRLDFDLGADGALAMEQSFDGQGAPLAAAIHLLAVTSFIVENRMAEVDLRRITVDVVAHPEPRTLALVGAHPSRSVARPGDVVKLHVDLAAYRGDKERRELETTVPSSLAAGSYTLLVGDGYSIDGVRLGIEQTEPQTLPQALAFLDSLHSRRELRVLGVVDGPGLSVSGEVLPDLPASVRSLWTTSGGGGARPLARAVAEETGLMLDRPVQGLLRVDLEIKRARPKLGAEADGDASGAGQAGESGADRSDRGRYESSGAGGADDGSDEPRSEMNENP